MEVKAADDAISFMRFNYDQKITLDRLAAHAGYSKFYFLRGFRAVTGVTPGRFLTAIRLRRSKELLALDDGMSVTDVSIAVGYDSMGAFSTKFRQMVGLTPTAYQAFYRSELSPSLQLCSHPDRVESTRPPGAGIRVWGRLDAGLAPAGSTSAVTHVGLFAGDSPQLRPVSCAMVEPGQSRFSIPAVPFGTWTIRAFAFESEATSAAHVPSVLAVGSGARVSVSAADLDDVTATIRADVTMRDVGTRSAPVVAAIPELHVRARLEAVGPVAERCRAV